MLRAKLEIFRHLLARHLIEMKCERKQQREGNLKEGQMPLSRSRLRKLDCASDKFYKFQ